MSGGVTYKREGPKYPRASPPGVMRSLSPSAPSPTMMMMNGSVGGPVMVVRERSRSRSRDRGGSKKKRSSKSSRRDNDRDKSRRHHRDQHVVVTRRHHRDAAPDYYDYRGAPSPSSYHQNDEYAEMNPYARSNAVQHQVFDNQQAQYMYAQNQRMQQQHAEQQSLITNQQQHQPPVSVEEQRVQEAKLAHETMRLRNATSQVTRLQRNNGRVGAVVPPKLGNGGGSNGANGSGSAGGYGVGGGSGNRASGMVAPTQAQDYSMYSVASQAPYFAAANGAANGGTSTDRMSNMISGLPYASPQLVQYDNSGRFNPGAAYSQYQHNNAQPYKYYEHDGRSYVSYKSAGSISADDTSSSSSASSDYDDDDDDSDSASSMSSATSSSSAASSSSYNKPVASNKIRGRSQKKKKTVVTQRSRAAARKPVYRDERDGEEDDDSANDDEDDDDDGQDAVNQELVEAPTVVSRQSKYQKAMQEEPDGASGMSLTKKNGASGQVATGVVMSKSTRTISALPLSPTSNTKHRSLSPAAMKQRSLSPVA